MMFKLFLGVDIWSYLCWLHVVFISSCCLLCILGKCGVHGVLGKDCFCRLVSDTKEWRLLGRKAERSSRKILEGPVSQGVEAGLDEGLLQE